MSPPPPPQAKLHVGLAHGERLAQCQHVKIMTTKALPVQIDGGIHTIEFTAKQMLIIHPLFRGLQATPICD